MSVTVEATIRGKDKRLPVDIEIIDPQGQTVYSGRAELNRKTPTRTVEQQLAEIEIPEPQLWDTEHPHLYTAIVTLLPIRGLGVFECKYLRALQGISTAWKA